MYHEDMDPDHLSYSSLNTYMSCPRAYYLSRIKQAEAVPAWYFCVGSAVHRAIELHLRPYTFPVTVEDLFMDEVTKSMVIEPDTSKWLHGGSDENPVIEELALKLAEDCFENALTFLEDFEVWEVEYDASGHLPGCGMLIKAYIDLLGEHKKHGPCIVDWKTGKVKPKADDVQLDTYNCLLSMTPDAPFMEHGGMIGQFKGLYVMLNPGAAKARPKTFKHTPESLGRKYGEVEQQIKKKIAKPEPQFNCRFCTMKLNCKTESGPTVRARYYDTPVRDGWVPF